MTDQTVWDGTLPDTAPVAVPAADEPSAPRDGMMSILAARRQEMLADTVELVLPMPSWRGELVATFSMTTKAEDLMLAQAVKARERETKDHRDRKAALHVVATMCRRLEFDGEPVDGVPVVSGFTPEFGRAIGADPEDVLDIVWHTLAKSDEFLGRLAMRVMKWRADPAPVDLTDADPFDRL